MTTDDQSPREFPWLRKVVIPASVGAVAGFVAVFGLMRFIDSDAVGGLNASAMIAATVGMLYCVIAGGMLVGTSNPRLGARFLNVEDADELQEQKRVLVTSSGAMALWGVALVVLALAAPDGPIPQGVALIVGAGGLLTGTALSYLTYRYCDELMLAINLEAGAITYGLVLVVVGMWALLAHLGFAAAPQPLDLLTSFYVLVLLASFIAAGRRGMLTIR
ncbi:hypothetical protein [Erythrobacter sp.]|uniref:hypothetical protein n=1 Tax=Erythrobacter sp. TaxID=1042 RepID=UPI0025EECBE4|nr:hypothetical protein [Erythrobacter sp.]